MSKLNQVKERPIIFTTDEVRTVFAGEKKRHRVLVKRTDDTKVLFDKCKEDADYSGFRYDGKEFESEGACVENPRGQHYVEGLNQNGEPTEHYFGVGHCPLGKVGDVLWVREAHHVAGGSAEIEQYELDEVREGLISLSDIGVTYRADAPQMTPADGGWVSPVCMPRWASRLTLKITDVKLAPVDTTDNWVWIVDFEVLGGV